MLLLVGVCCMFSLYHEFYIYYMFVFITCLVNSTWLYRQEIKSPMMIRNRAWRHALKSDLRKKKSEDILISPPDDNEFYRFVFESRKCCLSISPRRLSRGSRKNDERYNFPRRNRTVTCQKMMRLDLLLFNFR